MVEVRALIDPEMLIEADAVAPRSPAQPRAVTRRSCGGGAGSGTSLMRPIQPHDLRPNHRRPRRLAPFVAAALVFATSVVALAGSDTPPEGPPWVRSLVEAQKAALQRQVPIYVYLTKTH